MFQNYHLPRHTINETNIISIHSDSLKGRAYFNPPLLVITNMQVGDSGEYQCMAIVPGRSPETNKTVVSVHGKFSETRNINNT